MRDGNAVAMAVFLVKHVRGGFQCYEGNTVRAGVLAAVVKDHHYGLIVVAFGS